MKTTAPYPPIDARIFGPATRAQLDVWSDVFERTQLDRVRGRWLYTIVAVGALSSLAWVVTSMNMLEISISYAMWAGESQERVHAATMLASYTLFVALLIAAGVLAIVGFTNHRTWVKPNPYLPIRSPDEAQAVIALAGVLDDPIALAYLDAVRYEPRALTLHDLTVLIQERA
ncbi:hypothetical protein [Burkholderia alba]|uniref:hypothetical protein n=1 Tax=Burkholderia alba TaxID=2683677 RepID=UPI002B057E56|nr:hypothetical protein [Burkholderia alba]